MIKHAAILVFGTIVFFLVLTISGPSIGLKNGYRSFFISLSEFFFEEIGKDGKVRFAELDDERLPDYDIEAGLYSEAQIKKAKKQARKQGKKKVEVKPMVYRFSSWSRGFTPFAFLLCLVLFSPFPWKRKIYGFLIGAVLLHVILFVHLYQKLLWQFQSTQSSVKMYDKDSFAHAYLKFFNDTFPQSLDVFFIAAFVIWVLVMFKKADFEAFISRFGSKNK